MSAKTSELLKQLEEGIQNLFESDRYKEYLRFLSRFHAYSVANTILIFSQLPSASLCAGMSTWNAQGCFVKKGERGIRIIAPHTRKETDENGDERITISYHATYCFDISQVTNHSGKTMPCITRVLDNAVLGFHDLFSVLTEISPVPIGFEQIPGETCNGYFHPAECRIALKQGLPELQTVKTLIHEIAHSWLHAEGAEEETADRRTKETEAESVAYVVASYLGLDVSEYSFGYLAGWASDRTLPELKASLEIIKKTADCMIGMIEERLHQNIA